MKNTDKQINFNNLLAYEVGTVMGYVGETLYFLENHEILRYRIEESSKDKNKCQLNKRIADFKIARFDSLGERFFIDKKLDYEVDKQNRCFIIFKNNKSYKIVPENLVFFDDEYQLEICKAWIDYLERSKELFEDSNNYQYNLEEAYRKLEEME